MASLNYLKLVNDQEHEVRRPRILRFGNGGVEDKLDDIKTKSRVLVSVDFEKICIKNARDYFGDLELQANKSGGLRLTSTKGYVQFINYQGINTFVGISSDDIGFVHYGLLEIDIDQRRLFTSKIRHDRKITLFSLGKLEHYRFDRIQGFCNDVNMGNIRKSRVIGFSTKQDTNDDLNYFLPHHNLRKS